jgi:hypothetical protein
VLHRSGLTRGRAVLPRRPWRLTLLNLSLFLRVILVVLRNNRQRGGERQHHAGRDHHSRIEFACHLAPASHPGV